MLHFLNHIVSGKKPLQLRAAYFLARLAKWRLIMSVTKLHFLCVSFCVFS